MIFLVGRGRNHNLLPLVLSLLVVVIFDWVGWVSGFKLLQAVSRLELLGFDFILNHCAVNFLQ